MQRGDERALVGDGGEGRELGLEHAQPRLHVAAIDRPHASRLIRVDQVDTEVVEVLLSMGRRGRRKVQGG